jgi:HlyD family secretion protein
MDVKRAGKTKLKKRIRKAILLVIGLMAVGGITLVLAKLKPAAPTLDRSTAIIDTVKRGQMLRQIHGSGTLVPQVTRWIPAPSEGRVEKVLVQAGMEVRGDTVIAELSNQLMEQQALDADFQLKTAEAEQENLSVHLRSETVSQKAVIASSNAEYSQAKLQLDADETLATQGLVSALNLKISRVHVLDLANKVEAEQEKLTIASQSDKAQLNAQKSRIDQLRALAKLKHDQVENLKIRAGSPGVIQEVTVQVGQQLTPGVNLARVADPNSLKAELKIAETQMSDVKMDQPVEVDTHTGVIQGKVMRIDPAAKEGTVIVDVELTGSLPAGARADLTVDGTIELERLENVLHVARPAFAQPQATASIFRLSADGQEATRTPLRFGRTSVNDVEIVSGLKEGDQVILSDTSAVDNYNHIRLR